MSSLNVSPKDTKPEAAIKLFWWLWKDYLHKHKYLLVLTLILMALEGSTLALFSRMVQPMFDDVFAAGRTDALYFVGFVVMGIFMMRAFTTVARRYLLTLIRAQASLDMRKHLLNHLLVLDSSFFQTNPPGELIARVQGDVGAINGVWSTIMLALGRDLVSLVGLMAVAIWIDWRWTLLAVVGIPLLVLPSLMIQRFIRHRAGLARELAGQMTTRLDEVFHGINQVKLNSLEKNQTGYFQGLMQRGIDLALKSSLAQAAIPASIDIMTGIGFFAVLLYGGSEIIAGNKTNGEFMAFFTAMSLAFDPLRRLGALSGTWQKAAANAERLRWVLSVQPTIVSPEKPAVLPTGAPDVVLDKVSLKYGDLPVLRETSFTAAAGQTTALVGASGAGKSTIFNVLARLVDPDSGAVLVGGTATNTIELSELRGLFSVVTQDAALFDDTLRENILLGREDVDEATLNATLDAAHVSDFLPQLPNGLDSPAGPRGSNLSGGQRQRVAIARALLRDTPVLLLDEATSALDTKSEAIVQSALEKLSVGRTTIVIAHRLSTIRNAHSIVVMDKGRVMDHGTHEELLERGGIYADLYNMQFKTTEPVDND